MLEVNQKVNHPEFGNGFIKEIKKRLSPYNTPYESIIVVEFETEMLSKLEQKVTRRIEPTRYREFTETSIKPYLE